MTRMMFLFLALSAACATVPVKDVSSTKFQQAEEPQAPLVQYTVFDPHLDMTKGMVMSCAWFPVLHALGCSDIDTFRFHEQLRIQEKILKDQIDDAVRKNSTP